MNADENATTAATSALFASILRALRQPTTTVYVDASSIDSTVEAARQELYEWWRNSPFCNTTPPTPLKADYERLYRQLIQLLQQHNAHGLEPSTTISLSVLQQWIESDWNHDQSVLQDRDAVCQAILDLAQLATSANSSSSPVTTALSLIQQLRHMWRSTGNVTNTRVAAPSSSSSSLASIPVAEDGKPRSSMADKLAQMRERRSTMARDNSLAGGNKKTTTTAPGNPDISSSSSSSSATTTAGTTTREPSSIRILPKQGNDDDDDTAHFFTIESRLELKERLRSLQSRLDALLLETKLAWMKCFTGGYEEVHQSTTTTTTTGAEQLVRQGETLASHLLDAFTMAKSNKSAIGEYKALVAACEVEMASFQALVASMASAPSPVKTRETKNTTTTSSTSTSQPQRESMTFDLPSMKAYSKKAAPSYTAYLPKKTMYKR